MTNMAVAELGRIPMSPNLAATLSRATDYARAQAHVEVTLEHLLLALTEDEDAVLVLAMSNVDPKGLNADVAGHLGRVEERFAPDRMSQLSVSPDLRRILEAAAAAAQQSRRREINGAIVLAAVVGDAKSTAAHLLSAHGLTFEGAIRALQRAAQVQAPSPQAPPAQAQVPRPHLTQAATPVDAQAQLQVQPGSQPLVPQPAPQKSQVPVPAQLQSHTSGHEAGPASYPLPNPSLAAPPAQYDAAAYADVPTTGGRAAGSSPPSMDDLLAAARERVRQRNVSAPVEVEPPNAGIGVELDAQFGGPSEDAPMAEPSEQPYNKPDSYYEPDWGAAVEPPMPPGPPPEQHAPQQHPEPAAFPPRAQPVSPPVAMPPTSQYSGPTPVAQQGIHPHRSLPPDRGPRPGDGPSPPRPSGWTPPPQQPPSFPPPAMAPPIPGSGGNYPATRPQRSPPPLPPSPAASRPPPPPQGNMQPPVPPPWSRGPEARGPELRGSAGPQPGSEEMSQALRRGGALQHGRSRAAPAVEVGQLVENIPRTMRVARPQRVEVRIAKADVKALADGLQGGGGVSRHDVMVTKAMSVRLRAPDGGFFIESASPETQWIENTLGLMADDFASWRWTVTPRARGVQRLQLIVSARTVGADGLAAETALPDQVIEVRVRTNFGKAAITGGGWVAAAIAGGVLAKFGEGAFAAALKSMGLG